MNLTATDHTEFLLRRNGFTFNTEGQINYPRDGQSYFNQNLLLTLYINGALERLGNRFAIKKEAPTYATLQLAA
jgi:hypothetical protein